MGALLSIASCGDDDENLNNTPNKEQTGKDDPSEEGGKEGSDNLSESGKEGSYSYVDLGLSVRWATFNVGATKPTEYGDLLAWGETFPKETYISDNYDNDLKEIYTNYQDDQLQLKSEHDVAKLNWGGLWRMPTNTEIEELIAGCDWRWTENMNGSGVSGEIGVSKKNQNVIFFPAAGGGYNSGREYEGVIGRYWSNTLYSKNDDGAYLLYFESNGIDINDEGRQRGCSIRAVCN